MSIGPSLESPTFYLKNQSNYRWSTVDICVDNSEIRHHLLTNENHTKTLWTSCISLSPQLVFKLPVSHFHVLGFGCQSRGLNLLIFTNHHAIRWQSHLWGRSKLSIRMGRTFAFEPWTKKLVVCWVIIIQLYGDYVINHDIRIPNI